MGYILVVDKTGLFFRFYLVASESHANESRQTDTENKFSIRMHLKVIQGQAFSVVGNPINYRTSRRRILMLALAVMVPKISFYAPKWLNGAFLVAPLSLKAHYHGSPTNIGIKFIPPESKISVLSLGPYVSEVQVYTLYRLSNGCGAK